MARQGRGNLAVGISKVQQMSGARDPDTMRSFIGSACEEGKRATHGGVPRVGWLP